MENPLTSLFNAQAAGAPAPRSENPLVRLLAQAFLNPVVRDQVESARMIGQRGQDMIRAPAEAWGRMVDSGYQPTGQTNDPMRDQMARDSFDVAGAVPVAGLTAAAARPGISLGSGGGKLTRNLPMDEASRMARAREMGFDTDTTWYHGPNSQFDEFEPNYWVTADKSYADWVKGGSDAPTLELYSRVKNPYVFDILEQAAKNAEDAGVNPADITSPRDAIKILGGSIGWDDIVKDIAYDAKARGHDAILFKNFEDRPSDVYRSGGHDAMYVFGPENVRRTDAAFDPDNIDSANLLAANSSRAAIPGLLQFWPEE